MFFHSSGPRGSRKLGIKGIEGAAIPICASDTIGAAPCESPGTAGAGLSSQVSLEFINHAKLIFAGTSDLCRKHLRTSP